MAGETDIMELLKSLNSYNVGDSTQTPTSNFQSFNGMPGQGSQSFNNPFLPGLGSAPLTPLQQNMQNPLYSGMNNGMPVMADPGNSTGTNLGGLGSLSGWGDVATGAGAILGYFNGRDQIKLGEQQLAQQDANFNKNFDYAKELSEERRGRHNDLRSRYS